MTRLALLSLLSFAWLSAKAATNLAPATALLLDEKAVMNLTAGLKQYENPPNIVGKVSSFGSPIGTILLNRWASEFLALYPQVQFDIRGGGIEAGLPELLEGKVDLVPTARPLAADEVSRFKARFGYAPAQIVVVQDALGVYVNKHNPLPGLTLAQLDAIYSREPRRGGGRPEFWGELGVSGALADERISRFSLSRVHGTHSHFRDYVMQGADYRFDVRFELVPSSLVQAVGADDAGIGVASVAFATARTRFVPLQASDGRYRLPSYEETVSGRYPLVRPIRIVFNRKPDGSMNPATREFLRFTISRRGQRIVALAASYPLTPEQQREALRVLDAIP